MFAHPLVPLSEAPDGKFIVLAHGGEMHFVTAPLATHPYHANIVYAFIQEGGRGKAAIIGPTQSVIHTPGWKVLGGGRYEVRTQQRVFRVADKSTAYGKYPVQILRQNAAVLLESLGLTGFSLILE